MISSKQYIILACLLFYLWFFVLEEGNENLSPEELENYKEELSYWVRDNEEELRVVQGERRENVHNVCQKYGLARGQVKPSAELTNNINQLGLNSEEWAFLKRINWLYIYWSQKNSLIWCKVPKAGSSTWTYNFLKLAGVDRKNHIHKELRNFFPRQSNNKVMQDTFRFMVVRHPFERILSAYRDKLEDLSRDLEARDGHYYTMYGKHIVAEYRDKKDRNLTNVLEPTWREFITYILNTPATKYDEHWMPIWMLCSPCIIRYDVISKMETFAEDTQFILQQAGLEDKLEVEWKHRTGTGGDSDTIVDYYSQLTQSEIGELFKKYRLDFELYGYDPEPYFEIAQIQSKP